MASTFELEIVTPERKFFKGTVDRVVVRTLQGDIGILKDHMLTVSPLAIGPITIKQQGEKKIAVCAGGFIQIKEDKTTLVTDSAEWSNEIDVERAKKALERAQKRLEHGDEDMDRKRAREAFRRAQNRINVVELKE